MKKQGGITIVEMVILVLITAIILSLSVSFKISWNNGETRKTLAQVNEYSTAINSFKRKYGFIPGDLKKTQIFELSVNSTDGNEDGLIEDENQKNKIQNRSIKLDGEVANFWLHLYNSGFFKKDNSKNIFPYLEYLKTGILVFTDGERNYYHISVNGINKNNEIETTNNLTPNQAYLIDKKLDDGFPTTGKVFVYAGSNINISGLGLFNKKCSTSNEYSTANKFNACQLVMVLD